MELTAMTQITLDGVMQGNGGNRPVERERNGFERGGWARVIDGGDGTADAAINTFYGRADAFLLGRRTYELFLESWGSMAVTDAPGWETTWQALHDRPKHVASTTLRDPAWSGTSVLSGDLEAAVRDLKAQPGRELQVHGSGILLRWLLARGLVDRLTLVVAPVVLGQGARLFPEDGPAIALDLIGTEIDTNGITIQTFRPVDRQTHDLD